MQIVETSTFGVRSVVFTLERPSAPRFVLFPMVHVAEPRFYTEVATSLEACDVILLEGIRSATVSLLTLSYRFFAGSRRLGLVSQRQMDIKHLKERVVLGDMAAADFAGRWFSLTTSLRLVLPALAPVYGLYLRFFGERSVLARHMEVNDLASRRDLTWDEDAEQVVGVVLTARDRVIVDFLRSAIEQHSTGDKTVGAVYGAAHMPAIIAYLTRGAGYRIVKREFITVMSL
jgi:hypothetical protein